MRFSGARRRNPPFTQQGNPGSRQALEAGSTFAFGSEETRGAISRLNRKSLTKVVTNLQFTIPLTFENAKSCADWNPPPPVDEIETNRGR